MEGSRQLVCHCEAQPKQSRLSCHAELVSASFTYTYTYTDEKVLYFSFFQKIAFFPLTEKTEKTEKNCLSLFCVQDERQGRESL